ncbi:hypothetical protein OsccyDRAFT_0651 [Leptolyngbyaceae cyanobacterium JSC-12]|nr:hypothetical protein OsccyDRAFT_0651 [Leptolyngbyaceae cyanobacterium JSC-12]
MDAVSGFQEIINLCDEAVDCVMGLRVTVDEEHILLHGLTYAELEQCINTLKKVQSVAAEAKQVHAAELN